MCRPQPNRDSARAAAEILLGDLVLIPPPLPTGQCLRRRPHRADHIRRQLLDSLRRLVHEIPPENGGLRESPILRETIFRRLSNEKQACGKTIELLYIPLGVFYLSLPAHCSDEVVAEV